MTVGQKCPRHVPRPPRGLSTRGQIRYSSWVLHKDARRKEFELQPCCCCEWSAWGQAAAAQRKGDLWDVQGVLPGLAATLPWPLAENHCWRPSPWKNAPMWVHTHSPFDFQVLLDWPSPVPGTQRQLRTRLLTESTKSSPFMVLSGGSKGPR